MDTFKSYFCSSQNVTVRRSKSDGACYLKPLPEDLPRPKDLDSGFTQVLLKFSDRVFPTKSVVNGAINTPKEMV